MTRNCIAILALFPATALAQPVFFDDFDGDALLPHWNLPPPSFWEYNVSNGMLNVTGLFNPSQPHSPVNYAVMGARYPSQGDFAMDVWMGWEADPGPWYWLHFTVNGDLGQIMAIFGYRHDPGRSPEIIAGASGSGVRMPAPPPGIYHFTLTRVGAQFDFFLDGDLFASFPDNFGTPAAGVSFFFSTPYPGQMSPLHIDRVQVVPAPSAILCAPAVALMCAFRRNTRRAAAS